MHLYRASEWQGSSGVWYCNDVEDLADYFRNCEKDDINAAYQEWGKVFSEDEIRLVHLKFISENGN